MRISSRLPSQRVHLSLRVQFVAVTLVCFLTEKCLQGEVGKLLSSCSIRHAELVRKTGTEKRVYGSFKDNIRLHL